MIWEIERDVSQFMQEIRPTCLSFVYHGSVQRNKDMEGNREIGVVFDRRITRATYVLPRHLSLA